MAVKKSNPKTMAGVATYLRQRIDEGEFRSFFGPEVNLVPAPGHAPASDAMQQSSSRELARAMEDRGLGTVAGWLHRETKVPKSAWASPGERPTTRDHYSSVIVAEGPQISLTPVGRITVVDDVITSGATLHACVRRLRGSFPRASVLAFAVIRTMSGVHQIEHPIDAVERGQIFLRPDGRTERVP